MMQSLLARTVISYLLVFAVPMLLPVLFIKLVGLGGLRELVTYEAGDTPLHRLDPRLKVLYPVAMGVLSILPLTFIYVLMGVTSGGMHDPFLTTRGGSAFSLVTVAVVMFPSMLKPALTRSESFRASWVFFACPADRLRVIRSAKNVVVAFFLAPYLLFIGAIYLYFAHNVLHVLVHIALLGLISHLVLQAYVLLDPELPFSRPMQVGRRSGALVMVMLVMGLISGLLQAFSPTLYGSVEATTIAFGVLLVATIVLDLLTRARVERQARSLEFEG